MNDADLLDPMNIQAVLLVYVFSMINEKHLRKDS